MSELPTATVRMVQMAEYVSFLGLLEAYFPKLKPSYWRHKIF